MKIKINTKQRKVRNNKIDRERERERDRRRKKERKKEIKRENKKKVIDVRETIIEKWPLRGQR